MDGPWIEVSAGGRRKRVHLREGLRLGAPDADVPLPGAEGVLRFRLDPLGVRWDGRGPPPRRAGVTFVEAHLQDGDRLEWGDASLVCHGAAVLEELGDTAGETPAAGHARPPRAWRLVRAGLLVDLGLAPADAVRRWQQAVARGEFEPDQCAAELDEHAIADGDRRVLERAARLERDFLMSPLQTSARVAVRKARTGAAVLLSQGLAILVYTLLALAVVLLLRVRYEVSLDGWIDGLLDRVGPGGGSGR